VVESIGEEPANTAGGGDPGGRKASGEQGRLTPVAGARGAPAPPGVFSATLKRRICTSASKKSRSTIKGSFIEGGASFSKVAEWVGKTSSIKDA